MGQLKDLSNVPSRKSHEKFTVFLSYVRNHRRHVRRTRRQEHGHWAFRCAMASLRRCPWLDSRCLHRPHGDHRDHRVGRSTVPPLPKAASRDLSVAQFSGSRAKALQNPSLLRTEIELPRPRKQAPTRQAHDARGLFFNKEKRRQEWITSSLSHSSSDTCGSSLISEERAHSQSPWDTCAPNCDSRITIIPILSCYVNANTLPRPYILGLF